MNACAHCGKAQVIVDDKYCSITCSQGISPPNTSNITAEAWAEVNRQIKSLTDKNQWFLSE